MRDGGGAEATFLEVVPRFSQRAVEGYFAGLAREFTIDAATAVEFAAKAVVARHDVKRLYRDPTKLGPDHLGLLDPSARPGDAQILGSARSQALDELLAMPTVSAREAVTWASSRVDIDVAAAIKLLNARNRAVHIGDTELAEIDDLARVFGETVIALSAPQRSQQRVFGDVAAIANTTCMSSSRSPDVDAHVRVMLARRRWLAMGADRGRRSKLGDPRSVDRCPACDGPAHISVVPPGSAPALCLDSGDTNVPLRALDCLHCGLILYGERQIRVARHAR